MEIKATKKTRGRRSLKTEPLLTQTRGQLRHFGLRARKGLGQHFLIDQEVLGAIVAAAELTPGDVVIEIGPGLGVLTRELAGQAGWVVAVELDDKLAAILQETLSSFNNITIVNKDVLGVDPAALFEEMGASIPLGSKRTFGYKVVANLPYYITAHVLRHFLEASLKPQTMIVMVQKEVAEGIVAKSGRMSLLSISVQLYGKPSIVRYVSARCFHPVPEVDSAILRIDLYDKPAVDIADKESFFKLVRAGFTASRKQIINSLAQGLGVSKTEVLSLLAGADILPQRRAETLTLEEWARLWRESTRLGEPC